MSKEDVVQLWLDAEEENRKHTQIAEDKCLEMKEQFSVEFEKLSSEDKEYVFEYLEEVGA
jgi:hypothetical protein